MSLSLSGRYKSLEKVEGASLLSDVGSVYSGDDILILGSTRSKSRPCLAILPWLIHVILLSCSIVLFASSAWIARQPNFCVKKLSEYSPGLEAITDRTETIRFIGSFGIPTPYKGPPTPKVDARWSEIAEMGGIRITDEEFSKLNASKHSVRVPEELGGGYLALPEFVHQIHCVRILWQATWPDYFTEQFNRSFSDADEFHEHMDHCADLLRQKLMCDADMTLITYTWLKNHYMPHPNFNTQHQCRNFKAAQDWGTSRRIDASPLGRNYFTRPNDKVVDFDEPPFDPLANS